MDLSRDDRVRMSTKPEWGMGRVVNDPASGKVCILFREAGEKILSLKHARLETVGEDEAGDLWLDNLNLEPGTLGGSYIGPGTAVSGFLERYPGGFRGEAFLTAERGPKLAAREFMLESLDREQLAALLKDEEYKQVCDAALRVITKTNLVYPNDRMLLTRALKEDENRESFAPALDDLLYGDGDPDVRFKHFSDALAQLGAAKWTLATYFSFIRYPGEHMFLKPTTTQQAAAICRFDLDYKVHVNRLTYGRLLTFARVLTSILLELEPEDLFDVQSFMWYLAQGKTAAA